MDAGLGICFKSSEGFTFCFQGLARQIFLKKEVILLFVFIYPSEHTKVEDLVTIVIENFKG